MKMNKYKINKKDHNATNIKKMIRTKLLIN